MSGYYVDAYDQFITAVISAAAGIGLCLLYDVLRLIRYFHKPGVWGAFIQDILWWIGATLVTMLVLLVKCNGVVRSYALIGLAVGFLCCRFTISVIFIKLGKKIIDIIKAVLTPVIEFAVSIWKKWAKKVKKISKCLKNHLKDYISVVYNQTVLLAKSLKKRSNGDV